MTNIRALPTDGGIITRGVDTTSVEGWFCGRSEGHGIEGHGGISHGFGTELIGNETSV